MAPRKLLVFWVVFMSLFFFFTDPPFASAENVNFDFPSFNFRNLTFLGDSHIRNGVVGLTRELTVPSSSAGTVIYNNPIKFFDPEANITASFSTRFSFSITNVNPSSYGDGMSFFFSPSNRILGSPGGYLGLVNSSQLTKNKFVAIEFDTRLDLHFNDPNDNHVGLDIESLTSIKTADPILQDVEFKSGNSITAWIDYKKDLSLSSVLQNLKAYNIATGNTPPIESLQHRHQMFWKSHGGSCSLSSCLNCSSTGSILLLILLPFLYPEVMSGTSMISNTPSSPAGPGADNVG